MVSDQDKCTKKGAEDEQHTLVVDEQGEDQGVWKHSSIRVSNDTHVVSGFRFRYGHIDGLTWKWVRDSTLDKQPRAASPPCTPTNQILG
jgi:hypothetical protein